MYLIYIFVVTNFVLITQIECDAGYNPHAITRRTDPIICDDPNPDKNPMCYYWIHNNECSLNAIIPRLCPKGCKLCDKPTTPRGGYPPQGGGNQNRPGGQYGAVLRETLEAPYASAKQATGQGSNTDNGKPSASYDGINSATTNSKNNVQANGGYSPGGSTQAPNQPYSNERIASKNPGVGTAAVPGYPQGASSTRPVTTNLNNGYANTVQPTANSNYASGSSNPTTVNPNNAYSPPLPTDEQPTPPSNPYGNALSSQSFGSTDKFLANRTVASTDESETEEPLYHTTKKSKGQAGQKASANFKATKNPVEKDPFLASSINVTKFNSGQPLQKKDIGDKDSEGIQWAEWNAWGKCTLGRQFRTRTCSRGVAKVCTGSDFDFRLCDTLSF